MSTQIDHLRLRSDQTAHDRPHDKVDGKKLDLLSVITVLMKKIRSLFQL